MDEPVRAPGQEGVQPPQPKTALQGHAPSPGNSLPIQEIRFYVVLGIVTLLLIGGFAYYAKQSAGLEVYRLANDARLTDLNVRASQAKATPNDSLLYCTEEQRVDKEVDRRREDIANIWHVIFGALGTLLGLLGGGKSAEQ
jgi:hypothetical protein